MPTEIPVCFIVKPEVNESWAPFPLFIFYLKQYFETFKPYGFFIDSLHFSAVKNVLITPF